MRKLWNLEIHVTHGCNLSCESCSHYSNQGHTGHLSLEDADAWMSAWSGRVSPAVFSLLGGEPTIHPELPAFVPLVRKHWPDTAIRIVSNGFFLDRHPTLPTVLEQAGDAALYISIHHSSDEYSEKLAPNLELARSWVRDHKTSILTYPSSTRWTRRYKGIGANMAPYSDGDHRASWEQCSARYCPQIHQGRIYKCGPLAYLGMQDEKYGLSDAWDEYLGYAPLAPECSDAELDEFFDREDESVCGMCPAKPETFELPLPFPSRRESEIDRRNP
jgi:MoaA/NifB/PqqE/SkfB family radical SAM enzyme